MAELKVFPIKDGWYWCCGHKIQKIDTKTTIIGEIFCRYCKVYHNVIIVNGEFIKEY